MTAAGNAQSLLEELDRLRSENSDLKSEVRNLREENARLKGKVRNKFLVQKWPQQPFLLLFRLVALGAITCKFQRCEGLLFDV